MCTEKDGKAFELMFFDIPPVAKRKYFFLVFHICPMCFTIDSTPWYNGCKTAAKAVFNECSMVGFELPTHDLRQSAV